MTDTRVFSVEVHDYDEKAEEYCASHNELASLDRFGNAAVVVEYRVDEPRENLKGAWYVVLAPDDTEFSAEASGSVFRPNEPARLVSPGYDDAPKEWGELRQGFGLTREAAIASALAFIAAPPTEQADGN